MKITDKYIFFFSGKEIFSNFAKIPYTSYDGIDFVCSEQEFMYRKAVFFNDDYNADEILYETDPVKIKHLGRQVENFDDRKWSKVSEKFMYDAVYAKFSDNKYAREFILDKRFDGKEFVEASPYDRIWGVGLKEDNPAILDKRNWKGQNKLGKILTKVRNELLKK